MCFYLFWFRPKFGYTEHEALMCVYAIFVFLFNYLSFFTISNKPGINNQQNPVFARVSCVPPERPGTIDLTLSQNADLRVATRSCLRFAFAAFLTITVCLVFNNSID